MRDDRWSDPSPASWQRLIADRVIWDRGCWPVRAGACLREVGAWWSAWPCGEELARLVRSGGFFLEDQAGRRRICRSPDLEVSPGDRLWYAEPSRLQMVQLIPERVPTDPPDPLGGVDLPCTAGLSWQGPWTGLGQAALIRARQQSHSSELGLGDWRLPSLDPLLEFLEQLPGSDPPETFWSAMREGNALAQGLDERCVVVRRGQKCQIESRAWGEVAGYYLVGGRWNLALAEQQRREAWERRQAGSEP